MTSVVGQQRRMFWEQNGFLVLRGFFSSEEVDAVTDSYDRAWRERTPEVVVDDLVTGRRFRMPDLQEAERAHHFKVNDLYLSDHRLRAVALSDRLGLVLEDLLGDEPAICNTLNFEKGSQQPDHLDTLYMTPVRERGLVATWMALEDADPDSGPLHYYPESNRIPPYRFSTGSMHTHDPEMSQWSDYMAGEVERRGLQYQQFHARKGDLFIWHALLLHGGSEIADPALTRKSLVTHYWTQTDCEARSLDLAPAPGGWWIRRPPLSVPDVAAVRPSEEPLDPALVDFPAVISARNDAGGDLRERMEALEGAID